MFHRGTASTAGRTPAVRTAVIGLTGGLPAEAGIVAHPGMPEPALSNGPSTAFPLERSGPAATDLTGTAGA